jgi:NitT/TauT family transport system permease protein
MSTRVSSATAGQPKTFIAPLDPRRGRLGQLIWGRIIVFAAVVALWQLAVGFKWIDFYFFSSPAAIALRLWQLVVSGRLFIHLAITFWEVVLGFMVGAVLGVACGMAMAAGRLVPEILDPYIMALYGLPRAALAPLFVVWFGIGVASKVAVGASIVFFLCLFSTYSGMRLTDTMLLQAVKALGATKRQLLFKVRVPYAMPWIIAGLKSSVGMALIGTIVGEFVAASRGIGWYIAYAGGSYDTTGVMVGLLVLGVMSVVLNALLRRVEARLLKWKPEIAV